jgi:hypothetical protein
MLVIKLCVELHNSADMYDKAEEVMRMAISEVPDCAKFYSSLGIMLGKQKRLEVWKLIASMTYATVPGNFVHTIQEGEALLEKAVTLEPNSGNHLANLGKKYSYTPACTQRDM